MTCDWTTGTEKTKTVHIIFSCLLYRSGFQALQGGRVGWAVQSAGQHMSGTALTNRCNTARQCKQALADAIASSPDVSTFHSKMLACKSAMLHSVSFTPDSNNDTNGSVTDKGVAREANLGGSHVEELKQCNGPACRKFVPANEIKYCPCTAEWTNGVFIQRSMTGFPNIAGHDSQRKFHGEEGSFSYSTMRIQF